MPRTLQASVLVFTLSALAGAAQAQSLNELYEAARAYDASYLAARSTAETAQYRLTQAQALRKPTLGLGLSADHAQVDPPAVFQTNPATGARVQVAGDRVGSTTLKAGLSGSYSLYNRANGVTISQAERGVEVSRAELEVAEQDLMVRVAQAYFDVLAAREALATAQAAKKATAEQLASAKRNFEVGTATITDTREAQARFDRGVATELAAENDLRVKRVTLDTLVGRSGVEPKPLAQPVALPAVLPASVEPWLQQADENHPQIRRARLGLEVAQLEIDKARAATGPTLDATGTLGGQDASGRGASAKGFTGSATVGLQFKMPLYTGGATDARIKETLALAERSRNDVEFARRSVAEGTRRSFFGLQSLQAQVKAFEAAESSTKLALEATQLGYKVGVRVNLDVLNAQAQLFATQNDLAKARFDSLMTALRLRQAAGQLRPEDIAALDALLAK
ncbi:MAG: TolC family outer membrane protein [Burkholderiales bacterium]|uniref:TolC family outer membrane protein n=1 Tax=Inhella sp. TaxID=1921806 RepID=UPI001ACA7212|nr:TolC family outer membrane protein [Burkholderiales bacterium]